MDFGQAIWNLKNVNKVARKGWNGKGMFLFLDPGYTCNGYESFTGKKENVVLPHIIMKTASGELVPWLASQTDILADDWEVVE